MRFFRFFNFENAKKEAKNQNRKRFLKMEPFLLYQERFPYKNHTKTIQFPNDFIQKIVFFLFFNDFDTKIIRFHHFLHFCKYFPPPFFTVFKSVKKTIPFLLFLPKNDPPFLIILEKIKENLWENIFIFFPTPFPFPIPSPSAPTPPSAPPTPPHKRLCIFYV